MSGLNKVTLIGHLGADPESRSLNNGGSVVNLRIATSESWKDRDGNRQEKTEWHNVSIFNEHLGKIAMDYLRKGSKCYLEGKLQTRKWQDQSGADRYTTDIVLQNFHGEILLLDPKRDDDRGGDRRDDRGSGRGRGRDDDRQGGFDRNGGGGRDFDRAANRGGYDRDSRDNEDFDRGRGGGARPQPAAFDTDLDDDVPFISMTYDEKLERRIS